jgi:hypothetical protein
VKLFKRFPNFHPLSDEQPIVEPADRSDYPAFIEDFNTLDAELMTPFHQLDNEAKRGQNWYRWMYIILVLGGALISILLILQIAFLSISGFDFAGTVLAAILVAATAIQKWSKHHERYLNARLAAERLRSEYFLFLGHLGSYTDDQNRLLNLRSRVNEIYTEGSNEPAR